MSDTSWTQLIKQIAKEEREASKPCNAVTGKVTSVAPLKVSIGDKITLDKTFMFVCENVSDKLLKGDAVLLIRQASGQRYFLVDRLV